MAHRRALLPPPPAPPPAHRPRLISWRRLETLANQMGSQEDKSELQRMKDLFKEDRPNDPTHLSEVRDWILSIASDCLGTWRPRRGICRPFMSVPGIREILRRRQKAWKALSRSCQRSSPPPIIAAKQREHTAACREWSNSQTKSRGYSEASCTRPYLGCVCGTGVQTKRLFREFARTRLGGAFTRGTAAGRPSTRKKQQAIGRSSTRQLSMRISGAGRPIAKST